MARKQYRVIVVSACAIYRKGLQAALSGAADIAVVGAARSGLELLGLIERLDPDVVLVETSLPDMSGVELVRVIRQQHQAVMMILLTGGAEGNQFKGSNVATLSSRVAVARLVAAVRQGGAGQPVTQEEASTALVRHSVLTNREQDVLTCLTAGLDNHEIAVALQLSEQTVKHHITNILRKLGVKDRTGAVVYAYRRGWTGRAELLSASALA